MDMKLGKQGQDGNCKAKPNPQVWSGTFIILASPPNVEMLNLAALYHKANHVLDFKAGNLAGAIEAVNPAAVSPNQKSQKEAILGCHSQTSCG